MMRVSRVLIAIILASAQVGAASSSERTYADVIEIFRAGQDQEALDALKMLSFLEVVAGRDRLMKASGDSRLPPPKRVAADMELAVLLHTIYALRERAQRSPEFRNQINIALAYIGRLKAGDRKSAFVQTWWVMVIAFLHQQFAVVDAKDFAARARESVDDFPDLYIAIGATEEMGWTQRHEADGSEGFKGDLKEAERAYRSALAADPNLVEARLRLGRVLTLRGDPESLKVLEQIDAGTTDGGFRYLARLFEGDAFERQGDLAAAERQYRAAILLLPTAQSAHIALAHVQHVMGARTKAAAETRVTTQDRVTQDAADPWFWYPRGMFWHANVYLDALLRHARQ
jgi:tetratricopeptide (TPR) repeat protein